MKFERLVLFLSHDAQKYLKSILNIVILYQCLMFECVCWHEKLFLCCTHIINNFLFESEHGVKRKIIM